MQIYLAWSEERSKKLAATFKGWLPKVIQQVKPFYSESDIEKGKRWLQDLSDKLEGSDFGLLFMTSENLRSTWIHFEAGALSKSIQTAHVIPILFELELSALPFPLAQFQSVKYSRENVLETLRTINRHTSSPIESAILDSTFDKFWQELDVAVNSIIAGSPPVGKMSADEMLHEVLELTRGITIDRTTLPRIVNLPQFELYRAVYPEKFKAIRELMEQAVAAFRHVYAFRATHVHPEPNELEGEVNRVFSTAHSLEWLLGRSIVQSAGDFVTAASTVIYEIRLGLQGQNPLLSFQRAQDAATDMETRYNAFVRIVRREAHIMEFDSLFIPSPQPDLTSNVGIPDKE